jgi:alkylhydroperoxidase/carboxymuconolactone decarboxylase family protein YurZ
MNKKSRQLLEDMMKKRGYMYQSYSMMAEYDPEFLEAFNKFYALVMLRKRVFPEKLKELFTLCAIAARNPSDAGAMRNHIKRALKKGATEQEIFEALECTFFPGGALSLHRGLDVLIDVIKEKGHPS